MSSLPALDESEQCAGHGWSTSSRFGIDQQTSQSSNIYHYLTSQNKTGEVPDALGEEKVLKDENIGSSQNKTANIHYIFHEQQQLQQQVPENQLQQQKNSSAQKTQTLKTSQSPQSQNSQQSFSPQLAVHSTPHLTTHSPPKLVPHSIPQSVNYSTPQSAVYSVPQLDPHSTSQSAPYSTSQSAPYYTPQSTPYSRPQSVPHSTPQSVPQPHSLKQPLHLTQKVSYSVLHHQQQQGLRTQQPKTNIHNQFYSPMQQNRQIPMGQPTAALYEQPQQLDVSGAAVIRSLPIVQTDIPAGLTEEEINLELQRQEQQIEMNKQKLALLGVPQTHTSLQSTMVSQHLLTKTDYMTTANTSQQFCNANQGLQPMLQNSPQKFEIQNKESNGNNTSFQNITNHVIMSAGKPMPAPLNSLSGHKPNMLSSQQLRPIIRTNLQSNQPIPTTSLPSQTQVQVLSVSNNQNQPLDSTIPINKIKRGNVVLEGGGQFEDGQAYMIRDRHGSTRKMIWKNGEFHSMDDEQIQHSAIDSSQRGHGRGSRGRGRGRSNILRNAATGVNIVQSGGQGMVSAMTNDELQQLQQTTNITDRSTSMFKHQDLVHQVVGPSNQRIRAVTPNILLHYSGVGRSVVSALQSTALPVPRKPLLNKMALQVLMPAAQVTQKYVNTDTVQPRSAAEDKQADVMCQSNISTDGGDVKEIPDLPNIPADPNAVAVCQYCGYTSGDKLKCERCKRKFTSATKYVIKNNLSNQDSGSKRRKLDNGSAAKTAPMLEIDGDCAAMAAPMLDKKTFHGNILKEGKMQKQSHVYVHVLKSVNNSTHNTMRVLRGVPSLRGGRGRGRGILVLETVTISSDEEENVVEDQVMFHSFSAPCTPQSGQSHSPSHTTEPGPDCPESTIIPNIPTNKRIVSRGIDKMEDAKGRAAFEREKSVSPVEMMLNARTVRVGTFIGVPIEPILIENNGVHFYMEGVSGTHKFHIYPQEIQQCLANLDMPNCLIFFLINQGCAVRTRKDLRIPTHTNFTYPPPEPYFDPLSCYMCHQMITIVLDHVDQTTKSEFYKYMDMFKLWGKQGDEGFFMELSASEANDILKQSMQKVYPVQQSPVPVMPVVSDRVYSQQGEDDRQSRSPSPPKIGFAGPVIKLLTYPPPPEKGGISITNEDLYCLQEGEFLNDVIIDFYLKYLLLERLSPEDRARTHIFSSFFYKRLTQRIRGAAIDDDPCLTLPEKRHARVKTWTRHVDLFKKDFVVIPINEHAHWFLAIVCFPGLDNVIDNLYIPKLVPAALLEAGHVPTPSQPSDDNMEDMDTEETKDPSSDTTNMSQTSFVQETVSHDTNIESVPTDLELQTVTDNGTEAVADQSVTNSTKQEDTATEQPPSEDAEEKVDQSLSTAEATEKGNGELENMDINCVISNRISTTKTVVLSRGILGKAIEKSDSLPEDVAVGYKQPCILIFDSLSGPPRNRIVQVLKDYLQVEWTVKRPGTELNKTIFKGCVPKVPQQNNFSDCGVYMLQYVESFFQDPIQDFSTPMRGLHDWFSTQQINGKREEVHDLIISLKEKYESKIAGKEKT